MHAEPAAKREARTTVRARAHRRIEPILCKIEGKCSTAGLTPGFGRARAKNQPPSSQRTQRRTRLRSADADFAGDRMNFDAAAAVAHASAQRMLALFFDDDRHVCLDLTRGGFS